MTGFEFFALGVLTVIFLGVIVSMFRAWKHLRELKTAQQDVHRNMDLIDHHFQLHEKQADERFKDICGDYERKLEVNEQIVNDKVDEIYRYVNSRFDKFENKIKDKLDK